MTNTQWAILIVIVIFILPFLLIFGLSSSSVSCVDYTAGEFSDQYYIGSWMNQLSNC